MSDAKKTDKPADKPEEGTKAKGGSKKKLIIIIAAIVALLGAGGGGAYVYLHKQKEVAEQAKKKKKKAKAIEEEAADEDAVAEEEDPEAGGDEEAAAEGDEEAVAEDEDAAAEGDEEATAEESSEEESTEEEVAEEEDGGGEHGEGGYLPLAPAFVVNFQPGPNGEKPRAKFLSVEIEALPANAKVAEKIKTHMPAVRNAVIMHLSRQTYDTLITPEGKEQLRTEVLAEIQKVLKKMVKSKGVSEIYFTSFVMQ